MLAGAPIDEIKAVLESLGTNAFVVDVLPDGGLHYSCTNRRFEEFTGLREADLIGRPPVDVLPLRILPVAEAAFRRCLSDRTAVTYEESYGRPGQVQWRETTLVPMFDAEGGIVRLLGAVTDITARKQVEERLDLMLQNVPALISYVDKDQRYQFANQAYAEWLQRSRAEFLGRLFSELPGPEPSADSGPLFEALAGKASTAETEIDRPGLGRRSFQTSYIPDQTGDKSVRGVHVMTTDITEQRRTATALRDSEANLRAIFSAADDPILLLDIEGTVLSSNDAAARRFETTADDLIGRKIWEFAPAERHQQIAAEIDYAVSRRAPVWYEAQENGRSFEEVTYPIFDETGKVVRLAGCARDITDRKRAEQILRRRDAILEAVAFAATRFLTAESWEECIPDVLERLGRAANVSRAYIFENEPGPEGELLMSQRFEWAAPGTASQIANPALQQLPYRAGGLLRWEERLRQGKPVVDFLEWLPRTRSGGLAPQGVRSIAAVPLTVGETWWGFIGFEDRQPERVWEKAEIDVLKTAASTLGAAVRRQEIDKALHESEIRYQLAVSAGTVAIWDWHIDTGDVFGSAEFLRKLGYTDAENRTKLADWLELIHPDDRHSVRAGMFNYIEGRVPLYEREFRLVQKDGGFRWFIGRGAIVVRDANGKPVRMAGTLTDIAELKRAEEALWRRTEELALANEELKNFTYIVSHDLRAPLITIKGFTSELRASRQDLMTALEPVLPSLDDDQRTLIQTILEERAAKAMFYISSAADKMDIQLAAILKLSRLGRQEPVSELVDVRDVVTRALQGLSFQIEKVQAKVVVRVLPAVWTDREALDLVFGNLLSNAVKYLDPTRPGLIEIWAEAETQRTVFHIRDNGRGIAEKDLSKVFKIFRRAGDPAVPGEGVGLTYAKAAARRCGGDLWVQSRLGAGSTFSFSIPNAPHPHSKAESARNAR